MNRGNAHQPANKPKTAQMAFLSCATLNIQTAITILTNDFTRNVKNETNSKKFAGLISNGIEAFEGSITDLV